MAEGVSVYRFRKSSGDVYVLWREGDRETTVKLPVDWKTAKVTDIHGGVIDASPSRLTVSESPTFVSER